MTAADRLTAIYEALREDLEARESVRLRESFFSTSTGRAVVRLDDGDREVGVELWFSLPDRVVKVSDYAERWFEAAMMPDKLPLHLDAEYRVGVPSSASAGAGRSRPRPDTYSGPREAVRDLAAYATSRLAVLCQRAEEEERKAEQERPGSGADARPEAERGRHLAEVRAG